MIAGRAAGPHLTSEQRTLLSSVIARIPVDFGGGSSLTKALVVSDLVVEHNLSCVVEIGVYRGRFLFPQAALLQHLHRRPAVGIDPYAAPDALQRDQRKFRGPAANVNDWTRAQDWEALHTEAAKLAKDYGCELLRMTSADAASCFADRSIDVLHIDGNHDHRVAKADLRRYLPKLRPGGFVVMDDSGWPTIQPLCDRLARMGELVYDLHDPLSDDFTIFRIP